MTNVLPQSREDFDLKKVVFNEKSIEIFAEITAKRDDRTEVDQFHYTKKALPHMDLVLLRDSIKDFLIKAYGINTGYEKGLTYVSPTKKENIENALLEVPNKIEVTRVIWGGQDQLAGVKFGGKLESWNGSKLPLNTPRIVFRSEKLGFEDDARILSEDIANEVWNFIKDDKRALQNLFDGVEETNHAPKEEPVEA